MLDADGGNKNLQPERATTRSVSLAFHPEALRDLEAELSWFSIDYRDRVIQPIANASQACEQRDLCPVRRSITDAGGIGERARECGSVLQLPGCLTTRTMWRRLSTRSMAMLLGNAFRASTCRVLTGSPWGTVH